MHSLVHIVSNAFVAYTHTFSHGTHVAEAKYKKKCSIDDVDCTLDILDTAGQDEYLSMLDQASCAYVVMCGSSNVFLGSGYESAQAFSSCTRSTMKLPS
jgi:GTPase SAR1 family protein